MNFGYVAESSTQGSVEAYFCDAKGNEYSLGTYEKSPLGHIPISENGIFVESIGDGKFGIVFGEFIGQS